MHVLLTRPLEDCSEMILKFQSLGHQVSHLPLLKIEHLDYGEINFLDYKGIIFTSANAIKFLNTKTIDKKFLCFCVGSATEKKARSIGFQNVIAAEGNVQNLKELILQNFGSKDGKLVYVSGETISFELDKELNYVVIANSKRLFAKISSFFESGFTSSPDVKLRGNLFDFFQD